MQITVIGVPLPQGSKSAFVVNGRAVVTDGKKGPALKEWRQAIAAHARAYLQAAVLDGVSTAYPMDAPISLAVDFYLPRPVSAPKRVTRPSKKPDLDKLVRGVGDALAGIAYTQDSRIVEIWARKYYAEIGTVPHVKISVKEAPVE